MERSRVPHEPRAASTRPAAARQVSGVPDLGRLEESLKLVAGNERTDALAALNLLHFLHCSLVLRRLSAVLVHVALPRVHCAVDTLLPTP